MVILKQRGNHHGMVVMHALLKKLKITAIPISPVIGRRPSINYVKPVRGGGSGQALLLDRSLIEVNENFDRKCCMGGEGGSKMTNFGVI